MAIRDLLYACVVCGREGGIKATENGETCDRCGARYERVDGARIRCTHASGETETHHPSEWLDLLDKRLADADTRERRERVLLRVAENARPFFYRGMYQGSVERFAQAQPGWMTLTPTEIRFEPDQGDARHWRLEDLTAVQPSSSTLQLKVKRGPVLSLRFPDASPLLWEQRVREAVQALYTRLGKGTIVEFQPRIVCV